MHGLFTSYCSSESLNLSLLCPRARMEEPRIKYILLHDRVGYNHERNLLALGLTTKSTPMQVLRGELLEGVPETEQPQDSSKVAVVGIERKSLRFECPMVDMTRLHEEEANLLLAISSLELRYNTFQDRKRLLFGRQLSPGSKVNVKMKVASKELRGVVWYKGELPPYLGTWFGVQLLTPGQGTSDGTFRNRKYFNCPKDSGVFVGLDKLTPHEDSPENQNIKRKDGAPQASLTSFIKDSLPSFRKGKNEQKSSMELTEHGLEIDQRVVVFIQDKPARGIVRYIGDENGKKIVGLEMDKRIGNGTGKRNHAQKFIARRDYAIFVPLEAVMPEKDFDEEAEQPPKKETEKQDLSAEQNDRNELYAKSLGYLNVPSDQRPTKKKEQEGNVRRLVTEVNEQVSHLSAELREKEFSETNIRERPREKEQHEENLRRQLHEMEQQLKNLHGQLQERSEQLRNVTQQMTVVQGQLQEKDEETANLRNQATALRQLLEEKDQEMELQLTNLCGQLQERNEQLRDVTQQMTVVQGQLLEKDEETANLQCRLEEKDQEMIELETTLSIAQDELRDYKRPQSPEWVISRDRIQLTGKSLGKGGWGIVVEGKYCGCSVAVKQIHELILSPHNRRLFEREMDIASRCRHPCLLQFIGATNDEGNPLLVTELMETSLRHMLEQRALSEVEISFISLDVARALNYLHLKQPSIIHRDISSANVLLWRQGEHWRGKVSDYGTANFVQQTMTVAPGAVIYRAPETVTKTQTVKVDVYSFGVLLCEMCIGELPDPQKRVRQVAMVKNKLNRALIRKCLESEPEARPSIQEIINELEEPKLN